MTNTEIVRLKGVTVIIGESAVLEDVDLSIDRNDFAAVIGPNGSGKTTLLKVMLGLLTPGVGDVKVFGTKAAEGRKHIGYLPQHSSFDPGFPISVFDTVLMSRYRGFMTRISARDRAAVEWALEKVGMVELANRQIGSLSDGQMQRVFLARAIVREPKLLLLDEPTASIDPEMQNSFYELLEELKSKMAIVMVSHDVGVVFAHVNKVVCLNRKLFYHGPADGAADVIEEMYHCPIDLIAHGIPHRVLHKHKQR